MVPTPQLYVAFAFAPSAETSPSAPLRASSNRSRCKFHAIVPPPPRQPDGLHELRPFASSRSIPPPRAPGLSPRSVFFATPSTYARGGWLWSLQSMFHAGQYGGLSVLMRQPHRRRQQFAVQSLVVICSRRRHPSPLHFCTAHFPANSSVDSQFRRNGRRRSSSAQRDIPRIPPKALSQGTTTFVPSLFESPEAARSAPTSVAIRAHHPHAVRRSAFKRHIRLHHVLSRNRSTD